MYSSKEVLVVTTDMPSGGTITKHLKPITAHVVAGTNLFSDFFAGMSDIFGGRSGSYKKQLASIYTEAIESLQYEAFKIGANCVVGLRVDIDEISGQGKSMFMITAIGTAAIQDKIKDNRSEHKIKSEAGVVSIDEIRTLAQLREIISKSNSSQKDFSEEEWSYIISNRVQEVFQGIISRFEKMMIDRTSYSDEEISKFQKYFQEYLLSLPEEERNDLLYSELKDNNLNRSTEILLMKIIEKHGMLDLDKTLDLLENPDFLIRKRGVQLIIMDRPHFSFEDLDKYSQVLDILANGFVEKGKKTTKKQLLSSKEKEVWECRCGKINNLQEEHCQNCSEDIYGFSPMETKPVSAKEFIEKRMALIKDLFDDK